MLIPTWHVAYNIRLKKSKLNPILHLQCNQIPAVSRLFLILVLMLPKIRALSKMMH